MIVVNFIPSNYTHAHEWFFLMAVHLLFWNEVVKPKGKGNEQLQHVYMIKAHSQTKMFNQGGPKINP